MTRREAASIHELHLLTMKPMLYIANVDEDAVDAELPEIDGCVPVPISAKVEADIAELSELDPEEAAEYMEALGLTQSGLARLIHGGVRASGVAELLHQRRDRDARMDHPRRRQAPQAAGVIHTDFERGFIKAETASFEDYVALGGERAAATPASCARRARITWCKTATSCTSSSTCNAPFAFCFQGLRQQAEPFFRLVLLPAEFGGRRESGE